MLLRRRDQPSLPPCPRCPVWIAEAQLCLPVWSECRSLPGLSSFLLTQSQAGRGWGTEAAALHGGGKCHCPLTYTFCSRTCRCLWFRWMSSAAPSCWPFTQAHVLAARLCIEVDALPVPGEDEERTTHLVLLQ